MCLCIPLAHGQDDTDLSVFSLLHAVLTRVVQIHVHLSDIGVAEAPNLQPDIVGGDERTPDRPGTRYRRSEAVVVDPRTQSCPPVRAKVQLTTLSARPPDPIRSTHPSDQGIRERKDP